MTFLDLLQHRIRRDGARPLLTCYDADGARTELSATTYGNWVAKSANLVAWTLDADTGDRIALPVAARHPAHWMTLVWVGACWTVGVEVVLAPAPDTVAVVTGPDLEFGDVDAQRVACSLHPLGLGFRPTLPADVIDWAEVVKGEDDDYAGSEPSPDDPVWEGRALAEVLDVAPTADRVLVDGRSPLDPLAVVRAALVAPLLGGGSAVTVLGGDPTTVAAGEHATVIGV